MESPQDCQDGMLTPCFTLEYAAPEVLDISVNSHNTSNGKKHHQHQKHSEKIKGYSESCDLWSLGVILVRLILNIN